jgi:hypothetical protein
MAEIKIKLGKINPCYPYKAPEGLTEIPVETFMVRRSTVNGVGEGDGEEMPDIMDNMSDEIKLQRKLNGTFG